MNYTPEKLPRLKSKIDRYGNQLYFEPRLVYHFERKKWQLHYNNGETSFHYAFNHSFWEADTIQEVVKKGIEYFLNTPREKMYQFK